MSRLIAILLTLFPVLFASGEAAWGNVRTVLRTVSQAQVDRVLGAAVRSRVYTVNFYDKYERVVFSQSAAADNSLIKTSTAYDFAGNPTSVSSTTYIGFNTFTDTYTYGFDHLNRPTTVTLRHSVGTNSQTYQLVSNVYDNLGRLRSNGAPGRAAATFGYDMRSALTSISSNDFIQTLYRGEGTFPSKSGRITKNDIRLTGRHLTSNYQYDQAGRLIKAASALENTGVDYTEEFDYDLNTNIIGLRRYGGKNATTGALLDDLTMTYEGNQLRYVTDDATDYPYEASLDFRAKAPLEDTPGASVAGAFDLIGYKLQPIDSTKISPSITPGGSLKPLFSYSADYAYDANGNMTQDRHSSITSIDYNVLNLPQTVTYEGIPLNRPVSQTVYDASGKKHIVRNGSMVGTRFNGDETRYIGQYIMINDTIDRLQTPYGYLRDGVFHAYVFDYQGNVMAVVAGNNVVQTNLYYPDGLPMNTSTGTTANAFKYTAKELSLFRGLPVYDFTARHTLPAGGNMFRTMDPFAEKYQGISPYTFCAGDPVNYSDPTGREIEKSSMEEWMKNKSDILAKIGELQGDPSATDRIAGLQTVLSGMRMMEKSDIVFSLDNTTNGIGELVANSASSATIRYDGSMSNFIHETTHGAQLVKGDLIINNSNGNYGISLRDINDEVDAYRAQYCYDPSSFGTVNSVTEINSSLIRSIEYNGELLYYTYPEENINRFNYINPNGSPNNLLRSRISVDMQIRVRSKQNIMEIDKLMNHFTNK
ncbi:MAG: hypothetical protein HDS81_02240 [Bacteroidales bacterium]|nr:hypothetical protein [Bacteroidales bacterium]